jgi:serine/threonine protein kinase
VDLDDSDDELEGFERERRNHAKFLHTKHKNIVPMLCTLRHGSENMSIYPLARTSLQALFKENGAAEYTTTEMAHQMADILSALEAIHSGQGEFYGYHFDIKPANILVQFDKSLALTDFGAACFKSASDPAINIPECLDPEYDAPERGPAHGSFDIWSMGAVLLEFLVYLSEGAEGVTEFANLRREQKVGDGKIANFHDNVQLKAAVSAKLSTLQQKHNQDKVFLGCIKVAQLMLRMKPEERPTAKEAEVLLRTLLGDGMEVIPEGCAAARPQVEKRCGDDSKSDNPRQRCS